MSARPGDLPAKLKSEVQRSVHVSTLPHPSRALSYDTLSRLGTFSDWRLYPKGVPYGIETKPGYLDTKDDLLKRLEGHRGHDGLHRMVEADTYCVDILTHVAVATKVLQSVAVFVLEDRMRHCVADPVASGGDDSERLVTGASRAIERLVKS